MKTSAQKHGAFCMSRNRTRYDGRDIFIYAYTNAANQVLYVGRTADPATRHGAHRQASPWWSPDLTFSIVEIVQGWPAAIAAEATSIRVLNPAHNIQHNRKALS